MMKRIVCLMMVLVMVFALCACNKATEPAVPAVPDETALPVEATPVPVGTEPAEPDATPYIVYDEKTGVTHYYDVNYDPISVNNDFEEIRKLTQEYCGFDMNMFKPEGDYETGLGQFAKNTFYRSDPRNTLWAEHQPVFNKWYFKVEWTPAENKNPDENYVYVYKTRNYVPVPQDVKTLADNGNIYNDEKDNLAWEDVFPYDTDIFPDPEPIFFDDIYVDDFDNHDFGYSFDLNGSRIDVRCYGEANYRYTPEAMARYDETDNKEEFVSTADEIIYFGYRCMGIEFQLNSSLDYLEK